MDDSWREAASEPLVLQQGYLSVEKERTIRVRIIGSQAWLTLKGYISDMTRSELNTNPAGSRAGDDGGYVPV